MEGIAATPSRVRHLAERLANRDAEGRAGSTTCAGSFGAADVSLSVAVGSDVVPVPASARIRSRVRDDVPGIEIVSDFDPAPNGTWIWVACDAVQQCHELLEELATLDT